MIAGALLAGGVALVSPEKVSAIQSLPDLQSFYSRTLTSSISSTATTINVSVAPNVNTGLFVLEPRTSNQEIVYMTGRTGTALTVVRGLGTYGSSLTASTTNRAHAAGTAIEMADVHYYIKLLQDIILGSTSTPAFIVGGNATTTGNFTVSGTSTLSTTTITNLTSPIASFTSASSTNFYAFVLDSVTSILNSLTVGSLTATSSASLPATTFTGTPTWSGTPTNTTDLTSKSYVDGLVIAGAPISTNDTTGIGRTASSTQISSGYSSTTPYFIPSSLASSTASTSPIVVVTNGSGKISSTFINYNFGDGADGNVTVNAGSTTTLARDMYYNNLTVNGTIVTDGYAIYVKDVISGSGTIMYPDGNSGGNATDPTNSGGGSGSGSSGGNGGSGGVISFLNKIGIRFYDTSMNIDYSVSTTTQIATTIIKRPAGGGGGGGGSANSNRVGAPGGGGGASGGVIVIIAKNWTGSFTIKANGGNGGNGGNANGGQDLGNIGIGGTVLDSSRLLNSPGGNGGQGGTFGSQTGSNGSNGGSGRIGSNGSAGGNGGNAGAGGGSGGGGGGGGGGNGGVSIFIYNAKTWTGSYVLTGGTGGTGGTAIGGDSGGSNGTNGAVGTSYEYSISDLI